MVGGLIGYAVACMIKPLPGTAGIILGIAIMGPMLAGASLIPA